MTLYRKLPVEVEAVRFLGGNFHEIWEFVGTRTVEHDPEHVISNFHVAGTYVAWEDRSILGEVWDKLHSTWVGVKDGQWIIRGIQGEFYPCDDEVFRESYIEVLDVEEPPFEQALASLLNRYSAESVSGTPDFLLAEFMLNILKEFNATVVKRADWRGESTELPSLINFAGVDTPSEMRASST